MRESLKEVLSNAGLKCAINLSCLNCCPSCGLMIPILLKNDIASNKVKVDNQDFLKIFLSRVFNVLVVLENGTFSTIFHVPTLELPIQVSIEFEALFVRYLSQLA